jgi:hypothetical protein
MAAERDLEMLDDYLANRLGEQERSAFEQKLNSDPELKGEYNLQQEFINGIKKARVAELKTMMNQIPVPSATTSATAVGAKAAMWVVVAGIIATGLYLYLKEDTNTALPSASKTTEESIENTPAEQPENTIKDESPEVSTAPSSSEQKPVEAPKAVKKGTTEGNISDKPKIDVFDPTEDTDEESVSADIRNNELIEKQSSSLEVQIDSQNKKYNFHYQFKGGKLMLYGPFEKNLYEIMEFFGDDKRTIFMYYNDAYYLLKENSNKLKPLNPIQDPALVKKLKEYRNN